MLDYVSNLLYRRPELYELIYPEPDFSTARFCRAMFHRHLGGDPDSILDVGCGTGRDLATLSDWCRAECHGIDGQPQMIDYARRIRPHVTWSIADMRLARLGRTFAAIISLGGVVTYPLADDELDATLETFAVHAREGSLLVLDLPNAASFLPGGQAGTEFEFSIETAEFSARAQVHFEFDRASQILIRRRLWTLADGSTEKDFYRYRMLFPAELTYRLGKHGFRVVELFDNKESRTTDLSGTTLYVVAKFCGRSNRSEVGEGL
jgi:SAM-dependent methyltransferase